MTKWKKDDNENDNRNKKDISVLFTLYKNIYIK